MSILLCLCLVTLAPVAVLSNDCGVEDPNALLDTLIEKVRNSMDDVFPLSDFTEHAIKLEDGEMWGLDSIVRDGDTKVTCENGVVKFTGTFVAKEPLKLRYKWSSRFLSGIVYIRANTFRNKAVLTKKGDIHELEELTVLENKDVEVEVTGMGIMTWVWSRWTSFLANRMESIVKTVVAGPLRSIFNKVLRELA